MTVRQITIPLTSVCCEEDDSSLNKKNRDGRVRGVLSMYLEGLRYSLIELIALIPVSANGSSICELAGNCI